jgi:hypothetical protein
MTVDKRRMIRVAIVGAVGALIYYFAEEFIRDFITKE